MVHEDFNFVFFVAFFYILETNRSNKTWIAALQEWERKEIEIGDDL